MSLSLNSVFIAGNVTRDPEVRFTASGTAVCDLGIEIPDHNFFMPFWFKMFQLIEISLHSKEPNLA